MRIQSLSALGIFAVLAACSSQGGNVDDDTTGAVANSGLTELGAGTEIARCWFDVAYQSLSFSCTAPAGDGKVLAPKVLQISGKHPDNVLHQPISDTVQILPPAANPIDGNLILQADELPFDGRIEALINLPDRAAQDVVQAVDGRGGFFQPFSVASLDDARAYDARNPYVIKMPLETWQLRIALPTASDVALDVDPYHVTIAPWQSANAGVLRNHLDGVCRTMWSRRVLQADHDEVHRLRNRRQGVLPGCDGDDPQLFGRADLQRVQRLRIDRRPVGIACRASCDRVAARRDRVRGDPFDGRRRALLDVRSCS
ncbi:hypothetical protein AKJ09_07729 [Labilithrix luteola]|uniref:Lipoprotein n=1 Tax=Labilithrix luteola TaxID=1391654 RepID=A0A0K1Q5F9_9BACT|nr:hypothetical protein [Labilithrix luteola]AKV01066.1 hypothetical protein AKJ09_07729 [Labilithrix luteola]